MKKIVICTFLILSLAGRSFAAITVVAHAVCGSGTTTCTTSAINTTGATVLIAGSGLFENNSAYATQATISDSASNVWTPLAMAVDSTALVNAASSQFFICRNPTTSSTQTFTISATSKQPGLVVVALSGTGKINAVDLTTTAWSTNNTTTILQPGSITPINGNVIFLTMIACGTATTPSINDSFNILDQVDTGENVSDAYLIQTTAAALNPTWVCGSSSMAAAMINIVPLLEATSVFTQ